MRAYMYTSMIEEAFRPPEAVTNILVPTVCLFSYDRSGNLKMYTNAPQAMQKAVEMIEGRLVWDGEYIGEVNLPEEAMARVIAEGLELVSVKQQIEDLEKSKYALEGRIGHSLAPVRTHLEGQPTSP